MTGQIATDRVGAEIPIACTMTGEEQAAWSVGIGHTVLHGYEEMRELPEGYALRYPGGDTWAQTLVDFIVHERECCPFFTFGLIFEPNHGAIWLHMTGSDEIKGFVEALIETTNASQ